MQDKRDDDDTQGKAETPRDTGERAAGPDTPQSASMPETDSKPASAADTDSDPQDTPGLAPSPPGAEAWSRDTPADAAGHEPGSGSGPDTEDMDDAWTHTDPAIQPQVARVDAPGDEVADSASDADSNVSAWDIPPEPGPVAKQDPEPVPAAEPPGSPCAAGLFGKLPARGDFISRAIAQDLLRPFEDWLLPLVQNARALLGDDWVRAWRQAPPWRFWLGPDILRGEWTRNLRVHAQAGTVTGVMLPSADRQGRLFPLVLVLADEHARLMPPPVLEPPDRSWYAACDRLLMEAREGATIEAVEADLARLRAPRLTEDAPQMAQLLAQRSLWGQGAGLDGADDHDDVWSGIRASDHHLAATGRSYWWCEAPQGETSVISLAGLPDPETFAFMLTDAPPRSMSQTGADLP